MSEPIEKGPAMGAHYSAALQEAATLRNRIRATMEAYIAVDDARDEIDNLIRGLLPYLAKVSYHRGYMDGMKEIAEEL